MNYESMSEMIFEAEKIVSINDLHDAIKCYLLSNTETSVEEEISLVKYISYDFEWLPIT